MIRKIETFGFVTFGLDLNLLRMDVPKGYVCRLLRLVVSLSIKPEPYLFAKSFIPCLYLAWMAKARVKMMREELQSDDCLLDTSDEEETLDEVCSFGPAIAYHFPNCVNLLSCSKTPQRD
ncbi:hypothetical protein DM01DRAFT_1155080 [Hesseltinella vesiculosa]|uniref:Uncharacterized protein n=1 Tax=Hesseltinella vesiculosa TaxID=101127 RepID=A0A1X2G6A2_9FUNG|nr:hypothetical protein DM01DRAFT_1155080 [Hesseltinella vesiculosa]